MSETSGQRRSFGELEQAIVQIFEDGNSYTIREVLQQLSVEDKYTTVMTVMQRMASKGILQRQREGRLDVYTLLQRPSFPIRLLRHFTHVFLKMPSRLLARSLMEGIDHMEEEELLEMEHLIRERRLAKAQHHLPEQDRQNKQNKQDKQDKQDTQTEPEDKNHDR